MSKKFYTKAIKLASEMALDGQGKYAIKLRDLVNEAIKEDKQSLEMPPRSTDVTLPPRSYQRLLREREQLKSLLLRIDPRDLDRCHCPETQDLFNEVIRLIKE